MHRAKRFPTCLGMRMIRPPWGRGRDGRGKTNRVSSRLYRSRIRPELPACGATSTGGLPRDPAESREALSYRPLGPAQPRYRAGLLPRASSGLVPPDRVLPSFILAILARRLSAAGNRRSWFESEERPMLPGGRRRARSSAVGVSIPSRARWQHHRRVTSRPCPSKGHEASALGLQQLVLHGQTHPIRRWRYPVPPCTGPRLALIRARTQSNPPRGFHGARALPVTARNGPAPARIWQQTEVAPAQRSRNPTSATARHRSESLPSK